jgi:hypothetical protein
VVGVGVVVGVVVVVEVGVVVGVVVGVEVGVVVGVVVVVQNKIGFDQIAEKFPAALTLRFHGRRSDSL